MTDNTEPTVVEPELPVALPALLQPVAHPFRVVSLGVVGILVVIVCGVLITSSTAWTTGELAILQGISDHHVALLDLTAITIAWLFGTTGGTLGLFLWCIILTFLSRRVTMGLTFLVVVGVTWLGNQGVKTLVHRPRPDFDLLSHPLSIEHSFSYPSGHTCFTAALAIAVILMFRGSRRQPLVISIGVAAIVVVALSRVYLGVHHPADVIAAMIYASAAAAVIVPLWARFAVPLLLPLDRAFPVAVR
jgi:membrane-associated phospholipid phosphatase